MNMKNILLFLLALLSITHMAAEASGQSRRVIKVYVASNANQNNPVVVDLVLVKDKKLLKELMKLSAADWFQNRNQYRLEDPKEIGLSAMSWELVPGQAVAPAPVKQGFAGGIIFVNYSTPGAHRASINLRKSVLVDLGEEGFTITSDK
jgi:type VI secretion system protein